MARLILDTGVIIAAERRGDLLEVVVGDRDDVAIAAVTAAELWLGVELAGVRHRGQRRAFVEDVLAVLPVEPYDVEVAKAHAKLLAHVRRTGRQRGSHDLLIAATAVARRREVVSADGPGFEELPGVVLRRPPG